MSSPNRTPSSQEYAKSPLIPILAYALGAGAVLLTGAKVGEHLSRPVEINTGCVGAVEFPVSSNEPLSSVYERVAEKIESQTRIRPTDIQLKNSIINENFGPYRLEDQELADLQKGLVPKGYSVLLVPERCPDPTPQS